MRIGNNDRLCIDCGFALKGRADKKFCNDSCRSNYNNEVKIYEDRQLRIINQTLRKNRKILRGLNPISQPTIKLIVLAQQGFDFDYHTHRIKRNGRIYTFCYEFGYTPIDRDEVALISENRVDTQINQSSHDYLHN